MSADQGMDEDDEPTDIYCSSSNCIGRDDNGGSKKTYDRNVDPKTEQVHHWHVPDFGSIDIGEARARAAVEEWRTFTMFLEPQPGSVEAASVCEELMQLAAGMEEEEDSWTHFTIVTKDLLDETAKQYGISGKRALAQALVRIMARDRREGLTMKKALKGKNGECSNGELGDEATRKGGDMPSAGVGVRQQAKVFLEERLCFQGAMKVSETKQAGGGDEGGAGVLAARERAKMELRAARLLTTEDDDLATPDRVYILKGFPSTEADALQFLEENDAFFTSSASRRESKVQPTLLGADEKPVFLSALDAVVQLTTRPRFTGGEDELNTSPRRKESAWDGSRVNSSAFTQASGTTKALAMAQANGGTVWQDLSFCYINIIAREGPNNAKVMIPSSSEEILGEAPDTSDIAAISVGETKSILEIAEEFRATVTQMAFEKFDFHQWFSTAEVVTLPRRDARMDLALAVAEAREATMGSLTSAGGNKTAGSAARVEGSVWVTDLALSMYSDLMLVVPDELTSVATTLYCMVEAVKLECTGAQPRPLKTSLSPPLASSSLNTSFYSSSSINDKIRAAPSWVEGKDLCEREELVDSKTALSSATILAGTRTAPSILRNAVLEYGDFAGERATRGVLNCVGSFGEGRLDSREAVGIERAAIDKLQNPRLIGQGALPREPRWSDEDRGTEYCELMNFTDLGGKDVDRTRKVWALEHLVNNNHPPASGWEWNADNRRYWDVLSRHAVAQILREYNGTEPLCLRQYYPPTDELLVALHHHTPEGRASTHSWDPNMSGSIPFKSRPSFKDWTNIALPKDSSYTPRTLCAFGAFMNVSKVDMDRAKTKSVKIFPADHSLVLLNGFVATDERWLSTFKDGHVMGLRLNENDQKPSRDNTSENAVRSGTSSPLGASGKFAALFTMAFDDDSRLVVKESTPSRATPMPLRQTSFSCREGRKSTTQATSDAVPTNSERGTFQPTGRGTISCVQTFSTGLVVTTNSDGTMGMEFVSDVKRDEDDQVLAGFLPEAAKNEIARAIVGRGTVVRYMRDGSTQMLFATGDVVNIKGDKTTLTDKYGRLYRRSTTPSSLDWVRLSDPTSPNSKDTEGTNEAGYPPHAPNNGMFRETVRSPVRDVETGAAVWRPSVANGRAVVMHEDGLMVTRHSEGTVQRWRKRKPNRRSAAEIVLVECEGFPSVEIDVEIQEMCSRHAKGEPVMITRGGNRARLRAAMPNGGAVVVTYDTRVTSQICGRVVYVHSDNTEVIANERGEVVVRPRGLWEGRPVHNILSGPNSSMPPNRAQPDLLVGTYIFDCMKGEMETEDIDRNRFILDVTKTNFLEEGFTVSRVGGSTTSDAAGRPQIREEGGMRKPASSRPPSANTQQATDESNGVSIDLAGETSGVTSGALVTNPVEPRLFVYRRDGSALELLRNEDVQTWYERHSLSPYVPFQHENDQNNLEHGGCGDGALVAYSTEQECCMDPGARQLSFYVPLIPIPRGEGSFAAVLQRRPGMIFDDGYDDEEFQDSPGSIWRTRPLPSAARTCLSSEAGYPNCSPAKAAEVFIRRVWLDHPPLPADTAQELSNALAQWKDWKRTRVDQARWSLSWSVREGRVSYVRPKKELHQEKLINRFAVTDPRPPSELQAQRMAQKRIRKAFREAKIASQKEKERARTVRVQEMETNNTGALKAKAVETGITSQANFSEVSTMGITTPGQGGLAVAGPEAMVGGQGGDKAEEDNGVDFPDTEDEEDKETVLLREEAASAYACAGSEACDHLNIPSLRQAMVTVLGRAVREDEAESRLFAARKRSFPGQPKASLQDLVRILQECRVDQSPSNGIIGSGTDDLPAKGSQITGDDGYSALDDVLPHFNSICYNDVTRSLCLEPPPTPRGFWETAVGRSFESSKIAWTWTGERGGHSFSEIGGDSSTHVDHGERGGVDVTVERMETSKLRLDVEKKMTGDRSQSGVMVDGDARKQAKDLMATLNTAPPKVYAEDVDILDSRRPMEACLGRAEIISVEELSAVVRRYQGGEDLQKGWVGKNDDNDHRQGLREDEERFMAGGVSHTSPKDTAADDSEEPPSTEGRRANGKLAQGAGTQAVRSLSQWGGQGGEGKISYELAGHKGAMLIGNNRRPGMDESRSTVFEMTPSSISLGPIIVGRAYPLKITVTNVSDRPARFRVDHQLGPETNRERLIRVAGYPRGKVAAGLAVQLRLDVLATRPGAIRESLHLVTEDGMVEAMIAGEAVGVSEDLGLTPSP